MSYKITQHNSLGCEIDCRTVDSEDQINEAVRDIVLNNEFSVGDKLVVEEL